eukprot:COSAG02_NODE_1078_length_14712_cov_9.462054_8_plen_97_part_00
MRAHGGRLPPATRAALAARPVPSLLPTRNAETDWTDSGVFGCGCFAHAALRWRAPLGTRRSRGTRRRATAATEGTTSSLRLSPSRRWRCLPRPRTR